MSDLTVSKGDLGFYLNFTVNESDGTPFVLTGYTITLKVWKEVSRPVILFTGTCDAVVEASGTCRYLVVDGDLSTVGDYKMELELTKVGVEVSTITYNLNIVESP